MRPLRRLLPLVLAAALAGAGCGADAEPAPTEEERAAGGSRAAGARFGAAELRARLTSLLVDHAHLLGLTLNAGLASGTGSDAFRDAAATVDANSVALADAVAGAYGRSTGERFLALWREQVALRVDDARARATGDEALRRTSAGELARTRRELAALLAAGNEQLPAEATEEELEPLADGLQAYADALVARSPNAYELLREAAANAPMTAKVLADGIARRLPARFDGSATAGAGELRGTLTGLLAAHAHLLGTTAAAGAASGFEGELFEGASDALAAQGRALSRAIGRVFGDDAARGFLERWRTQDEALLRYARAQTASDRDAAAGALADLEAFRTDLAGFLASISPQLPAGVVAEALDPVATAQAGAIRAAVKGSGSTFERLAEASAATTGLAALLADGIARQFPDRFPPR